MRQEQVRRVLLVVEMWLLSCLQGRTGRTDTIMAVRGKVSEEGRGGRE